MVQIFSSSHEREEVGFDVTPEIYKGRCTAVRAYEIGDEKLEITKEIKNEWLKVMTTMWNDENHVLNDQKEQLWFGRLPAIERLSEKDNILYDSEGNDFDLYLCVTSTLREVRAKKEDIQMAAEAEKKKEDPHSDGDDDMRVGDSPAAGRAEPSLALGTPPPPSCRLPFWRLSLFMIRHPAL